MAWKVFDLVVDGSMTLKNRVFGVTKDGGLSFDGNMIPLVDTKDVTEGDNLVMGVDGFIVAGASQTSSPPFKSVTENKNTGYRLFVSNPSNYGDIGNGAIDFSYNGSASSSAGATGDYAIAIGTGGGKRSVMKATGYASISLGIGSQALADYAIAIGDGVVSNGYGIGSDIAITDGGFSVGLGNEIGGHWSQGYGVDIKISGSTTSGLGYFLVSDFAGQTVLGNYNLNSDTNAIEIGDGSDSAHSNSFEIKRNGVAVSPKATVAEIEAGSNKSLTTVEYVKNLVSSSVSDTITIPIDVTNSTGTDKLLITIPSANSETSSVHFSVKIVFAGNNYQANVKFYYEGSRNFSSSNALDLVGAAGVNILDAHMTTFDTLEITPYDNTSDHSEGIEITEGLVEITMPKLYRTIDMTAITATLVEDVLDGN